MRSSRRLGPQGSGDGPGERIGIDVVGLAVGAEGDRSEDRDQFRLQHRVEDAAFHMLRLAHEAEIDLLLGLALRVDHGARRLAGADHVAVLAAEADGATALGRDPADDLFVDRAGEHHLDHLDGRLVGDAQASAELRLNAEPAEHAPDLRAAAMNHDGLQAGLLEEHDILGEIFRRGAVAHGVAAIFDDDDLLIVALHVGQGLDQNFRAHMHVREGVFCQRFFHREALSSLRRRIGMRDDALLAQRCRTAKRHSRQSSEKWSRRERRIGGENGQRQGGGHNRALTLSCDPLEDCTGRSLRCLPRIPPSPVRPSPAFGI